MNGLEARAQNIDKIHRRKTVSILKTNTMTVSARTFVSMTQSVSVAV